MFDSQVFDLAPYAGFDMDRYVRRTYCSFDDAQWRSLLVQRFTHAPAVEALTLPATADLHLVLVTGGQTVFETLTGRRWQRHRWAPGRLEAMPPHRPSVHRYRSSAPLRTVQLHLPSSVLARTAAELGLDPVDPEALAASVSHTDALVIEAVRTLSVNGAAGDLYAESAAAFLAAHLLAGPAARAPVAPEDARIRRARAYMRERLSEPITLEDIAAEVHLSVYHFVRVFRDAVGETPHRYLTRMRIEQAQRLLTGTDLSVSAVAERCGFSNPGAFSATFLKSTGARPSAYRNF